MKTAGILAGLGPLAGAHFYRRIIELTPSADDSQHIPIILASDPEVPSRLAFLQGSGPSPIPRLVNACQRLVSAGADFIAIPSSTTHIFYEDLANQFSIPFISIIKEVASEISKTSCKSIGLLATAPTKTYGVYNSELTKHGIKAIYPDSVSQSDINAVIDNVKRGRLHDKHNDMAAELTIAERLNEIAHRSWCQDVDGILLACTEIPVF
ncbi:MAG: aspartate/glutamate racemase family protein, partial [Propionibacteriaceae bacterium]